MQQTISTEITNSLKELETTFSSIKPAKVNTIPFDGSWTAAQVADHILQSQNGILELVQGSSGEAGRDPDEKIQQIAGIFLDFSIKMQSPDFIAPSAAPLEAADVVKRIHDVRIKAQEVIPTLDLSLLCTGFELPVMGYLTKNEWLHFFLYHTQRHNHQLANIATILNHQ